jgi:urea carboxylase
VPGELAEAAQVQLLPGSDLLEDAETALAQAEHIGLPVMVKSTAGGGGIGMQICRGGGELRAAFESVQRLSRQNFGHSGVFLGKYIGYARHVEVQIFGDGEGRVLALGDREWNNRGQTTFMCYAWIKR